MKKFLAILSALLLMIMAVLPLANASAEATFNLTSETTVTHTVTFRNDIKFGMTADQVKAAETQALREQTFDKQNPHVTFLTTEDFDINEGHMGTVQYLFWDGKMYSVIETFRDQSIFNEFMEDYNKSYGEPTVSSADGTATFVESVTGNHPDLTGNQYVWDLGNKVSLTLVKFGTNFAVIYIDAN